ncbi:signal recognition particle-docking protein FtsY [Pasteurellaceae bacterium Orientalotternb1]|nr:signal recognition particle-docking protein FtsY [Pasteurellaceae bacterium Orientalotternb1]
MADEKKKKGFWSWLGFGKKDEPEAKKEESQAVSSEENFAKNSEKVTACEPKASADSLEEKVEAVIDTLEDKAEQLKERVEEVIEQAEEKLEQFAEQVEEKVEQIEDAVEDAVEQAVESVEEIAVHVADPAKAMTQNVVEEIQQAEIDVEEAVEQAVESVEEITNHVVDPAETIEQELVEELNENTVEPQVHYQEKPVSEGGFFSRLINGLIKTKQNIGSGFRNFFRGKKIDDDLFEELEEQLLVADLGMPTTTKIINNLIQHASKQQLRDAELLYQQLKVELADVLKPVAKPLELSDKKPYVILMVGVNGVGKTTTIGKLARKFQAEGKSVMLAAGDTFRAAAVEQLQVWGERNHIPVVAQATGSDSASVIFDAMQSAAAKGIDVLIADTAGRLQNKNNLMDELKKIVRVMKKYDETAPHEIMLTLDAGTGQNAISQAKLFHEAVGLTGITLTKLDGTAKGGVIFAIADQFNIPIRYIGVGEKIDDLRPFNADEFIEALFTHEDEK